jgi:uncharacterized membrane protein (UPF0182 family)
MTNHRRPKARVGRIALVVAVLAILLGSRTVARYMLEYQWWKEVGQIPTWINLLLYGTMPVLAALVLVFAVLWVAHARGLKKAGTGLREHPVYARLSTLAILLLAIVVASSVIDNWTVVRFFGSPGAAGPETPWHDPVFAQPLSFYFFQLPFYQMVINFVLAVSLLAVLIHWGTARGWQIRTRLPGWGSTGELDLSELRVLGNLESNFLKAAVTIFLLSLAAKLYLERYALLLDDHNIMVGVDWISEHVRLPLLWATIGAAIVAAALFIAGRWKIAALMALVLVPRAAVPPIVAALYVRPNEIALQKPYLVQHIGATRSAFGLETRTREVEFQAHSDGSIDFQRNKPLLDNVRLWDWRAFHDTVSQAQPLRPYVYSDSDVDRYRLEGRLQQVLLAPRELELNQLGEARNRWINRSLTFTHGYGLVLAEATRITPDGLPGLLIENAPPQIKTPSLKLTRPELYYSEVAHEPVFVNTGQPEFNYPSGTNDVNTRYEGHGGFPISSFGLRLAAALSHGDWNIVLTNNLVAGSRMMIRRKILERLEAVAGFVSWDPDPYLVITDDGRLVWTVDGYLTSAAHPYARALSLQGIGRLNYIRNSVKATVDAYQGTVRLYVFDETDPLVRAYRHLFPGLFLKESEMPADLRAHVRAPEILFRAQAEIYRTFHMRDPESFYNKADLWDLATFTSGQGGRPQAVAPTYVVATLPGETAPEFLLVLPFTPHNKQNLIGFMAARCDDKHLGELVFLQLAKQEIIRGPQQIEALINQDQNISKDLTLWNREGSQVLRSQMIVLPVDQTFLYVAPIYIQSVEARMPQLRKVVLATGNTLIYADNYEQGLQQLAASMQGRRPAVTSAPSTAVTTSVTPPAAAPAAATDSRVEEIRNRLRKYRELSSQGKWAEAGKELEAIENLVRK